MRYSFILSFFVCVFFASVAKQITLAAKYKHQQQVQADASLPVTLSVTDKYICIYILHIYYTHSYICTIYNTYTYLANIPWGRNKKMNKYWCDFSTCCAGGGSGNAFQ